MPVTILFYALIKRDLIDSAGIGYFLADVILRNCSLLNGRKLSGYITLSILEEQLPSTMFMKVHKSYLVSLPKIDAIEGNELLIQSVRIPISRNLKEILMKKVLENKLLKR